MKQICKIWSSELYSNNKVIAHNTFAIPVLTPKFGIIQWTKEELEQIDMETRKILSCNGSFHVNSDIDRLNTRLDKAGRHSVIEISPTNKYLNFVRPANEILKTFNICSNDT